jgi:7-cyano-7-deazaguanine synthase
MNKQAVLSLSGGLDSSTLLLHLLANGYEVTALSFDYGQKHKVELERATDLVEYINNVLNPQEPFDSKFKEEIKDLGYDIEQVNKFRAHTSGPVKHQIIKLDGLSELLNSTLVEGGKDVPEGHYEQDNMKETVVPNRNKIFSSLVQAVALSLATKPVGEDCDVNQEVKIALGIHAGDHAIYPDCRQEFRDADMEAFRIGNWNSDLVDFYTPYLEMNKFTILQDGEKCCEVLGLDFDEVYKRTNTSYKPIKHYYRPETYAFKWYSDYKSAASVERIEAFINLGRPDPVEYADETGPVEWEVAKTHVEQVLTEYKKANI